MRKTKKNKIRKSKKQMILRIIITSILEASIFAMIIYLIVGTYNEKYRMVLEIIDKMKPEFGSDVFANPKDDSFESSVRQIYQTFDGKECYPSIEEKAANFLYLIVKNHVFADGNKRIAATLFIYFLNFYGILHKE